MNKQRKTSHILNVFQYDADGHVILPASLTLSIAPTGEDNSGKVPTTAWVRSIVGGAVTAYTPTSRTITINGTSYDLSSNRSWSIDTGVLTATAGSGISVSVVSQNLNIVNTGLLTATAGAGISVSTVSQNLNIVNTGLLTATAGSGITVSVVGQNLNVVNTGILTATAGSGISLSVVGQNLNVVNTGILTATAGAGISVSVVNGNLNVVNTITNNNQLTNGAGYITSSALTGYATETYVGTAISNLIDAAPGTLDTLNELAAALGDDPNFATTVATSIGTKQAQLNGTGFVKVTGTTVSYDNSTYLTTSSAASTYVALAGSYANPAWITSLAWSKITGAPTTISGYGITNAYTDAQIQNFFNGANAITGYNKSNWDTAFGWGNHASAGYLTTSSAASTYVSLTGSYANPSWITSLAYSKITGVPAFLTSYTETDTLSSVTGRGASTSTAVTFSGGATISNLLVNGAAAYTEGSLALGAHGTTEGGQLVLNKATSHTFAAHLDVWQDVFRILYGTNTATSGVAMSLNLSTRQLILPQYQSATTFTGTAAGVLAFDSSGNILTIAVPGGAVSSVSGGTGVSVNSTTGAVVVSIGQSVATSAQVTFDSVITNNNGNGTNFRIGDDVWIGDINAANTFRIQGVQNSANAYIVFGNGDTTALGRAGTGALTYGGNTVYHAGNLTNLNQLTNGPGYITSYTETDTLATVTSRGATTSTALTLSGRVTFSSTLANRPQFPGGILGLDTGDGNFDIWGISRDYYPSHATAANAWGLRWNGDNNDFEFVGGGTSRVILDMDSGNITATGTLSASGYNKTNWDTAYGWGNHSGLYLSLSGGTLTGPVALNDSSYFRGSSTYGFRFNNNADTLNLMSVRAAGDMYVRGQVYVGGDGFSSGTQLVYNSGTWGINISGTAASETLSTVTGRGNSTGSNIITSANSYANAFYDYADNGYYFQGRGISRMYGIAIRGDNNSTGSDNQIFFWGGGNSTTSAIGFKANGGAFGNPTGFGDGYNTYLTMDTDGRGWVFRRGVGGTDFSSAYTSGWILNNGVWQANSSMRAPIFYDSNDTGYYVDPNDYSRLNKLVLNQSRVNSSRYPIGHYTPGETVFEIDPTWSNDQLQAYFNSGSVAWTNDSGAPGGYAIRIDGSVNVGGAYSSGFPYIPVDQDDIFYMECWIKSVSGTITHYMGSIDYDSGFSSLGGNPGSFGYWTMSNTSTSTSWQKVAGYITGFGGSTGQFVNGTKYWTPQALFNYGQISGSSCVISGWKVIRVGHAGNRTFRNNINVLGQVSIGTTNTRLTSNNYNGYVEFRSSSSNYLGVGVISNNGWGYIESVNNSNGLYLYTVSGARFAFDNGDVTPYNDAENSLGNGSYRWAQVYTSGWLRQYGAQGMYNQDYGTHFYSSGSASWNVTGSGGNVELVFRSNHQSTVRGYVYADTSNNIGFLNNSGNWSLRMTSGGDAYVSGYLYVNGAGTSSSIFMQDSDEGQREIHCNSNRIGFLNQSGSWGSWCDDSGNWLTGAGVYASVFYDYDNGGYYLDPNSMSNLYSIQMPHLGNGTSNLVVNNGGSENWGAIRIEGGSGNLRIGKSDAGRSWSGRVSLAMHVGASESFRVHSDGWTSLFEVWGGSGYARLRESLEIGGDLYLGTRGNWLTTLLDAKQNSSSAINSSFRNVIEDTRGGQRSPNDYDDYRVSYEFTNQMPHDGNWLSIMTLQGWHNGYAAWQIQGPATSAAQENWYLRSGINTSWNTARTIIHSGNIGSQSVNNSAQLDGYGRSNFLGLNGNSYYQANTWIQLNGWHGLYAPSWNGAHWMPNNASTYTTWRIAGSRNGYSGLYDDHSGVNMIMFDSGGNGGAYRENNGRWYWYHHLGNNCTGISTSTTSSSYRAYIGGSLYAEGDVVAYSDVRKKTDIVTIDNALEKVTNLRGVFYTRIDDPQRGRQTGVIAQEINKVLPEVVTYAADVDEYGVSYGNIVGVLIEAIKEQQKQIEDLTNKINLLTQNK